LHHVLICLKLLNLEKYWKDWDGLMKLSDSQWKGLMSTGAAKAFKRRWDERLQTDGFELSKAALTPLRKDFLSNNWLKGREYILNSSGFARNLLLLIISSSLPLQTCRAACRALKIGGWKADSNICCLCFLAPETLGHFLFDCPQLSVVRKNSYFSSPVPLVSAVNRMMDEAAAGQYDAGGVLSTLVALWRHRRAAVGQPGENCFTC
jgi:hypothetical protein